MKRAVHTTASSLGLYAALLSIEHGVFEIMQGNSAPPALMFNAMGPPCVSEEIWHACLPSMSLIPNFLAAGVVSILIAACILVCSLAFLGRSYGGKVLIALSVLLLLAGGGFIPPMIGIMAGLIGINIHTPLGWWRERLPEKWQKGLVRFWPRALNFYFMWVLLQWVFGDSLNEFLMEQGLLISFVSNGLLLLMVFSAVAYDLKQEELAKAPADNSDEKDSTTEITEDTEDIT